MDQTKSKIVIRIVPILFVFFVGAETRAQSKVPRPPVPTLKEGQYAYALDEEYKVFDTIKNGKLIFDKSCSKNTVCLASKAANQKLTYPSVKLPGMYNPAAEYCRAHNGKPIIAIDNRGRRFDFCSFMDKSFVDSWSMLTNHYPPKVRK